MYILLVIVTGHGQSRRRLQAASSCGKYFTSESCLRPSAVCLYSYFSACFFIFFKIQFP